MGAPGQDHERLVKTLDALAALHGDKQILIARLPEKRPDVLRGNKARRSLIIGEAKFDALVQAHRLPEARPELIHELVTIDKKIKNKRHKTDGATARRAYTFVACVRRRSGSRRSSSVAGDDMVARG